MLWGTNYERAYGSRKVIDGISVYTELQSKEERVEKAEELYAILAGKEF